MRIYLLFAILGLAIVEAFLVPRSLRDFRIMQKMRRETAPTQGLPISLGPFAGYDTNGRPLALVTDDTRWIVPLVIHTSQLASDLDYLGRLRKALPNRAITFVGVCDNSGCADGQKSEVPLIAYGSYAPLQDIVRLDGQGQVLLLNQFWGVTKSLPRTSSMENLAAEIQQVTGK